MNETREEKMIRTVEEIEKMLELFHSQKGELLEKNEELMRDLANALMRIEVLERENKDLHERVARYE